MHHELSFNVNLILQNHSCTVTRVCNYMQNLVATTNFVLGNFSYSGLCRRGK